MLAGALLTGAIALAGCGGDDEKDRVAKIKFRSAVPASSFPQTVRKFGPTRTLAAVLSTAVDRSDLVLAPGSSAFYPGKNRYSFVAFTRDKRPVPDAKVALYFAQAPPEDAARPTGPNAELGYTGCVDPGIEKLPRKLQARAEKRAREAAAKAARKRNAAALKSPAIGPFPARVETLETEPAFRAQTTANDPDAGVVVYIADVEFPCAGEWRAAAIVRPRRKNQATLLPSAIVGQFKNIPRVGDRPPRIHTPTAEDVGGRLEEITTRVPPDTQNEEDFADVLGKEPVVLLFATPQFCVSRVCGPVVDIAEQVKREYGDEAAFIHMEIFNDNDPNKDVRPQVRAFALPSEPWLFLIDRKGIIRTAIEGAFSVRELENAVEDVIRR